MSENQSYMQRILALQQEICNLADKIVICHCDDQNFYEKIAKMHVLYLKDLKQQVNKEKRCFTTTKVDSQL